MKPVTFKQAVCRQYGLHEDQYESFVLGRSLFSRVRLVAPLVRIFNPEFLFVERRLVQKIANAHNLKEIQDEIDFYQHKYVVNFVMKEALRFRLSGMRLMSLANKAFRHACAAPLLAGQQRAAAQEPVSP